jgi:hypothetical protein
MAARRNVAVGGDGAYCRGMSVNVLFDKASEPDDRQLEKTLGSAWPFFVELRDATTACIQEWKHYGKKYGWKLKVHADDKTLLELTAADGWFLAAMAIRDSERKALLEGPAQGSLASLLDPARAPEGYGLRIEVRDRASCQQAIELVRFIMKQRQLG